MDANDIDPSDVVAGIVRLNNELEAARKENRRLVFENGNLRENLATAERDIREIVDIALRHMQASYDEAMTTCERARTAADVAKTRIEFVKRKIEEERAKLRNPEQKADDA